MGSMLGKARTRARGKSDGGPEGRDERLVRELREETEKMELWNAGRGDEDRYPAEPRFGDHRNLRSPALVTVCLCRRRGMEGRLRRKWPAENKVVRRPVGGGGAGWEIGRAVLQVCVFGAARRGRNKDVQVICLDFRSGKKRGVPLP